MEAGEQQRHVGEDCGGDKRHAAKSKRLAAEMVRAATAQLRSESMAVRSRQQGRAGARRGDGDGAQGASAADPDVTGIGGSEKGKRRRRI
ncbi:hypothetical protein Scep_025762 [Stephania cephalantha]|uniref:Uncharacterized protein n=1 Tax=Stephania cephalantha TaxID=152367 RepID=A0AAP0EPF4_9MAGN